MLGAIGKLVMRDRRHGLIAPTARSAGFTLVEVLIAMALVPVLLAPLFFSLRSSAVIGTQVGATTHTSDKLRAIMRRIGDELRMSSLRGEDTNGNGDLDPGEDKNDNGLLESDWDAQPNSITFNRLLPDETYSLATSYFQEDDRLVRRQVMPAGDAQSVTIARGVQSFSVLVTGAKIVIGLNLGSAAGAKSTSITVTQRN